MKPIDFRDNTRITNKEIKPQTLLAAKAQAVCDIMALRVPCDTERGRRRASVGAVAATTESGRRMSGRRRIKAGNRLGIEFIAWNGIEVIGVEQWSCMQRGRDGLGYSR